MIKGLLGLTGNPTAALNLYLLLTYPLVMLTSCIVWRRLGLSYPAAIAAALLFTFLPYHFYSGGEHIFLASCYLVPLAALESL